MSVNTCPHCKLVFDPKKNRLPWSNDEAERRMDHVENCGLFKMMIIEKVSEQYYAEMDIYMKLLKGIAERESGE